MCCQDALYLPLGQLIPFLFFYSLQGYDDAYAEQSYEGYEGYYSQGQQ